MPSDFDFKNIAYLKTGNKKQKRAYDVLTNNDIMIILQEFDPILVGTIPINIDLDHSDLDIICHFTDADDFEQLIIEKFGHSDRFKLWESTSQESLAKVANFYIDEFEIEIFGVSIPTNEQRGYRHMLIEHKILQELGNEFRKKIIA